MQNVTINTQVVCTDEPCGKSTNVVINPVNHQVTHLVLEDKSLPDNATRLVPVTKVAGVTPQQIKLNCAKADVAKMPPFLVSDFIAQSTPGHAYESGAAYSSQYVLGDTAYDEIQERNIPAGELALYSGMHVEAADGKIGTLGELVIDPKDGAITSFLLRKGHLWGAKDITIAVADIEFIDGKTVYLKLDKAAVNALPAVKVQRK
jgi:sporulation protein YlmC with PRC-barrel domain